MKLLISALFCVALGSLGEVALAAPAKIIEVVRVDNTSAFSPLDPQPWHPSLDTIVIRSMTDTPTELTEAWGFGLMSDLGMLSAFQFQVRDSKGVLPAKFYLHEHIIYLGLEGHPSVRIPFAAVGRAVHSVAQPAKPERKPRRAIEDAAKEDAPEDENAHWELHFLIAGMQVVRESNPRLSRYSLMLPQDIELLIGHPQGPHAFLNAQRTCIGELEATLIPHTL